MKRLILFLLCVVFAGCDPIRNISLQKSKDPNKSVVLYGNERLNSTEAQKGKSVIALQPNEQEKTVRYAIGTWDRAAIGDLSQNIDSIVCCSGTQKQVLIAKEDIQQFLKQHVKTLHKNTIEIKRF